MTAATTGEVARHLKADGWHPLPLPAKAKKSPPTGYTGYAGKYPTAAEVDAWDWGGNIALRLPPDVVGVDIDVYHGGDVGLQKLEAEHGQLPATTFSTSRTDGSGIALFRVPNGTTLETNPADGIDMIQSHHRYMVVGPSIHPEGRTYQWFDEQSGEEIDGPPPPEELPDLPWGWITGLAVSKTSAAAAANPQQVRDFIGEHTDESFPQALKGVRDRLNKHEGSRHDNLVEVSCWALREAAAGLYPARDAIDTIRAWWDRVMDDPVRRNGGEFGSALMWAVAQVLAEPERVAEIREERTRKTTNTTPPPPIDGVNSETGEITRDYRNLPDEFWDARPVLQQIRQAAHSRLVSADAVLLCVLSRIALLTPSSVVLPAIVGTTASLNLFGGLIGPSGGGKSTSAGVARELLPSIRTDVLTEVGPGSGEGLIEAFLEMVQEETEGGGKRMVKRQAKHAVEVWVDEGQSLLAQSERSGATIMPIIRSAWNGETLTTQNASAETFRRIESHHYRLCILLGLQPAYTADLIADAEGGTPQRFVFAMSTDPSLTGDVIEWPGEIEWSAPAAIKHGTAIAQVPMTLAVDIAKEIRERALAVRQQKVTVDPLDAHADLAKLKLAAALAILDGRDNINADDWDLACTIWRTSRAVRTWVIELADSNRRKQTEARTAAEIHKTLTIADETERKAIESGARSIARKVASLTGPASRGDIARAPSGRVRKAAGLDDMVAKAASEGWIEQTEHGWIPGPRWERNAA